MSARRRISSAVLVSAAAALGAVGPATDGAVAATPPCSHLSGRDLVTSPAIKVVARSVSSASFKGRRYFGCAMPSGPILRLGINGVVFQDGDPATNDSFSLGVRAGTHLIVSDSSQDASGAGQEVFTQTVWDLATARHRLLWRDNTAEGGECLTPSPIGDPGPFTLGANGIAAAVYTTDDCAAERPKQARVVVSVPRTARRILDTAATGAIPTGSLSLSGRTLRWTSGGTAKSATL